jgi:prepilin-type processing-associated H-X9-DG protein
VSAYTGYSMNIYTFAPTSPVTLQPGGYNSWALRTNSAGAGSNGWYFKQNQWRRPSERALIFDSSHPNTSVTDVVPWWSLASINWTTMPPVPDITRFTIDFNRHGRVAIGNKYTDKSVNVLFADGRAETVSCKEAHRAVRFTVTN